MKVKNFKSRIAFYYMMATATIMAIVFGAIYLVVWSAVFGNLDSDLSYEAQKHSSEIRFVGENIEFVNKAEWAEREHTEIQVNPVFIQIIDKNGKLMDKSPNLKGDNLPFRESEFGGHFDTRLNNKTIRQVQLPLEQNGKIKGYILAAMSSEASFSVILKLRNVLITSYFIVLIGLYFVSRFMAGRSIVPIQEITKTISRITKNNLKERVKLPANKDEIYVLSSSFNALLERIEQAIEREKQFTSDASHELRTPLATLRGTLEVLVRKPRTPEEYEEKIHYSLQEIGRMTATLEQLLLLARLDPTLKKDKEASISLTALIDESISWFKNQISQKNLKIDLNINNLEEDFVPHFYCKIIMDNILNNAIKYSNPNTTITIDIERSEGKIICKVKDEGIGIKKEDLSRIYDNFFRSEAPSHKQIPGNGLGLSIVRKCADAIGATLKIASEYGRGTTVTISF